MEEPVTAIILAAGASDRFGEHNKLLQILNEVTVIEKTVEQVSATPVGELVVVTGHQSDEIERRLRGVRVRSVFNPDFETGMASSIVCGVQAVDQNHHILVWPADMPLIMAKTGAQIVQQGRAETIVVPVFEGQRGHPVFFGRSFRDELILLKGDRGARPILDRHPESVVEVEVADPGVVLDVDTEGDLLIAAEILKTDRRF